MKFNLKNYLFYFFSIAFIFIVWQIFSILFLSSQLLPAPIEVISTLINSFVKDNFTIDIIVSVERVLVGFFIASLCGIFLGIVAGTINWFSRFITPIIELFRPIPPIAWIPLAILWFGLGDQPAYFLVFLGAFFPIFSNTYFGISSVEKTYKRAAYSLGASSKRIIFDVLLPASLPHIFTGLKIGLGIGWMAVIAAELVGAQSGLGYFIQMNRVLLDVAKVVAGMITIGVVGFLLNFLIKKVEVKMIPWNKQN